MMHDHDRASSQKSEAWEEDGSSQSEQSRHAQREEVSLQQGGTAENGKQERPARIQQADANDAD